MMLLLRPIVRSTIRARLLNNSSNKQFRHTNHLGSCLAAAPATTATRCMSSSGDGDISTDTKNSKKFDFVAPPAVRGNIVRPSQNKDFEVVAPDEDEITEDMIFDREFADMKAEDFKSLYEDDKTGKIKPKIEVVLNEYESAKYNSMGRVPSKMEIVDMARIIEEGTTPSIRSKIIHYFYKREMDRRCFERRKLLDQAKRASKNLERKERQIEKHGDQRSGLISAKTGEIIYGLWHNSLFTRVPENKIKAGSSDSRLRNAALFGRKIVFDCDFEEYMSPWICRNTMDQIQEAYGLNRFDYQQPYDLWLCNFNRNSPGSKYIAENAMPNLYTGSMITVKEDCFTNHFEKSQLIYLTPDAKERLEWSPSSDDVYIIGAFNDKSSGNKPLTYRKAISLGIKVRSLPLDSYIAWQGGTKSLCLNHVLGILLEVMANGGDWQKAMLKHIPPRKIKPVELVIEEEKRRLDKFRTTRRQFSIRDDLF